VGLRAKLPDDHPTLLAAINGLAGSYQRAGQVDRAVSLFESNLAGRRAKLGLDHPDTLRTTIDLAKAYVAANEPGKALPLVSTFLETAAKSERPLPESVKGSVPEANALLKKISGTPPSR
jgi:hypothetical protein